LSSFLAYPLADIPFVFVALILALTLHEFAHAYVAYLFGDPTAKNEGRVTLNPLAHLDPVGTLLIFLMGVGWAKPVPVNRSYFRKPRLAGVLVSVAGPISNLLIAFFSLLLLKLLEVSGVMDGNSFVTNILFHLFDTIVSLNLVLFIFNLIPLPPLDGYRIVEDLVSQNTRSRMQQYEQYGILVFLLLWITPLGDYLLNPLFYQVIPAIYNFFIAVFHLPISG
jgi:Zn-dependent protease